MIAIQSGINTASANKYSLDMFDYNSVHFTVELVESSRSNFQQLNPILTMQHTVVALCWLCMFGFGVWELSTHGKELTEAAARAIAFSLLMLTMIGHTTYTAYRISKYYYAFTVLLSHLKAALASVPLDEAAVCTRRRLLLQIIQAETALRREVARTSAALEPQSVSLDLSAPADDVQFLDGPVRHDLCEFIKARLEHFQETKSASAVELFGIIPIHHDNTKTILGAKFAALGLPVLQLVYSLL